MRIKKCFKNHTVKIFIQLFDRGVEILYNFITSILKELWNTVIRWYTKNSIMHFQKLKENWMMIGWEINDRRPIVGFHSFIRNSVISRCNGVMSILKFIRRSFKSRVFGRINIVFGSQIEWTHRPCIELREIPKIHVDWIPFRRCFHVCLSGNW